MKKLILGGLAALAISLTGAAPAQADDAAEVWHQLGHEEGLLILDDYSGWPTLPALKYLHDRCQTRYKIDSFLLKKDQGVTVSQTDFLAGCYEVVGQ